MSRGIEGRRICVDDMDRNVWLKILGRTAERFGWQVFAFSLLDNHYHLFARAPEGGLARGMRQLNGDYAGYFNRRHRRRGPLMQGRYRSVLVEDAGQWSELSRYVHLNPVRAGMCRRPEQWKWSSYPGYQRPARRLGAESSAWQPGRKVNDLARAKCAYALRQATGARHRELAAALGYRSASSVGAACRLVQEAARSPRAKKELEALVGHASK
jgi:REP element-mobilizing transposase RayT